MDCTKKMSVFGSVGCLRATQKEKKLTFSGESDSAFFCRYNSYVVNYNL